VLIGDVDSVRCAIWTRGRDAEITLRVEEVAVLVAGAIDLNVGPVRTCTPDGARVESDHPAALDARIGRANIGCHRFGVDAVVGRVVDTSAERTLVEIVLLDERQQVEPADAETFSRSGCVGRGKPTDAARRPAMHLMEVMACQGDLLEVVAALDAGG